MRLPEHNVDAQRFDGQGCLEGLISLVFTKGCLKDGIPVWALYIRATLSILPIIKYMASGDQAKSYISAPEERHICLTLHTSSSSVPSPPNAGIAVFPSSNDHNITFPSSPADARTSPV